MFPGDMDQGGVWAWPRAAECEGAGAAEEMTGDRAEQVFGVLTSLPVVL